MFQLGSLVVFYVLLIGTSESLLDNADIVQDILKAPTSASGDALQNLNVNAELLQEITDWSSARDSILRTLNTVDIGKQNLRSYLGGLGLQIHKVNILNLQTDLSSDLKGIDLKLPVVVDASVSLPLIGSLVDISVSLDLITSLIIQNNAQTGLPTLSIGKCSSDSDKISISLLGRQNSLVNGILDNVSGLISKAVRSILQNQVCPLLQLLLRNPNATLTQDLISSAMTGQLPVSI